MVADGPRNRQTLGPTGPPYAPGVTTAYLAPPGFEEVLEEELALAGVTIRLRHDRLLVSDGAPIVSAWAANIWFDVEELPVASIGDAAKSLRAIQRNWARFSPVLGGRSKLIEERLPHVSARPLELDAEAPAAPLGSWTLLSNDRMLAAGRCSNLFPNGEPGFVEDRVGPPSRAYLKVWEALVRLRRRPIPGERCLDLGASPGGWTWFLARTGATVLAVDKAPLDPALMTRPNVTWQAGSAFALEPRDVGLVDWLFSDIICYPSRLLALVERWHASGTVRNFVCTIKFQGETDHGVVRSFVAIPGAQVMHLHNNKHELTFALLEPPGAGGSQQSRPVAWTP